jgi:pimeloyl-ACP methyl ester carboxylesterase/hemoglobin-like flavoprotein/predicted Ser/Thr protein kinase
MPEADSAWTPPSTFDDFSVEAPLGRGGMGQVYLGRDLALDRAVALKFIRSDRPDELERRRFEIEARAIARLAHPNVVSVYRYGEVEGRPYIAYEFVAGRPVSDLEGPLPWTRVLGVAVGMARGLAAVHRAGLVHRDVKSANLMLSDSGDTKLIDFGLARGHASGLTGPRSSREPLSSGVSRDGTVTGTPAYMAPELWEGAPASPASDVFAAGLVLRDLLVEEDGRALLELREIAELFQAGIPSVRVTRPDVPSSFARVVDRCLRPSPLERYRDALELLAELEALNDVFLPAASFGAPRLEASDVERTAASFARVTASLDEFTIRLYERLFAEQPRLRPLFPRDLTQQRQKLAHALKVTVDSLRTPARLTALLEDLGRTHLRLGVTRDDLALLGEHLLATLRELDAEHWEPALQSAWTRAWQVVLEALLRGYEEREPIEPPRRNQSAETTRKDQASSRTLPRTRYTRGEDTQLAYQVFGNGPLDLLVLPGWLSQVEVSWRSPRLSAFLRGLSAFARVILYDKRGSGLSDRGTRADSVEARVRDVGLVLDDAGSKSAVLFGMGEGGITAVAAAALIPERVAGLVTFGSGAQLESAGDYPFGLAPQTLDEIEDEILSRWGEAIFVELEAPSVAADPTFLEWRSEYLRLAASPREAIALLRDSRKLDVRELARKVRTRALVLARRGDRVCPLAGARDLASRLEHARFVELEGDDHLPFVGDSVTVLHLVDSFVRQVLSHDSTVVSRREGAA